MKLEYGKRYITRNATIVGPLDHNYLPHGYEYPFWCESNDRSWTPEGLWSIGDSTEWDIVAEVPEPEPFPEPEPEIVVNGHTYVLRVPKVETVVYEGHYDTTSRDFYASGARCDDEFRVKITFDVIDGKPDWSTAKIE